MRRNQTSKNFQFAVTGCLRFSLVGEIHLKVFGQTLIEKLLYSRPDTFIVDNCYSGHFFWATGEHFAENLPVNSGHPIIVRKNWKTHECFCFTQFFTLTWSSLFNFSKLFSSMLKLLHLNKKIVYLFFESKSKSTIDCLSIHLYKNVMLFKLN